MSMNHPVLAASVLAAACLAASATLAGPARVSAPFRHPQPAACRMRDWGSTREIRHAWYICQPAGHARFAWQPLGGRQMAS
jgi:hypothetical protein